MNADYLGICTLCTDKIPVIRKGWAHKASTIAGKGKWVCGRCLYNLESEVSIAVNARNKAIEASNRRRKDLKEYGVVMDSTTGKLVKIEPERKL
jgi:hypothetical protein